MLHISKKSIKSLLPSEPNGISYYPIRHSYFFLILQHILLKSIKVRLSNKIKSITPTATIQNQKHIINVDLKSTCLLNMTAKRKKIIPIKNTEKKISFKYSQVGFVCLYIFTLQYGQGVAFLTVCLNINLVFFKISSFLLHEGHLIKFTQTFCDQHYKFL